MEGLYGFLHRLLRAPFKLIFNVRLEGIENEPKDDGAYLICSNHTSAWDPIWLGVAMRRHQLHFMAKAELFKIPVLNALFKALGAYPVNRKTADVSSIKNTIGLLKNGKCVGLFPQGTRRAGFNPAQTEVKNGVGMIAVRAEVPVLPIFIETKNFKRASAFTRKKVIVGKPIPYAELKEAYGKNKSYTDVSRFIFGRICELGGLMSDGTSETDKSAGADDND